MNDTRDSSAQVDLRTVDTIQGINSQYPLHLLGWKAFQDLCVAVAEECLRRPIQIFLPNNDAGRDGAFVGRWDGADPSAGESTIQCKFTSKLDHHLSISMLKDELEKARALAIKGLAIDYIILTNHSLTGASDIKIKAAFKEVGVGNCRVFGYDWIVQQIKTSPRLRMMAPRLYGLGDLSDLLDARAYAQAKLILSSMGDDLQRIVITEAYRKSVRAISAYNIVLLLGAPAAGKSTIGASLALGAADIWQCGTIRATSPEDIKKHLSPGTPQFFWIDDAWGSTQYQRQTVESWNQIFPLMQGAIKSGTRFLITSRDYIWKAAKSDLKLQALAVLNKSQVIINVEELSVQEKAQILYNHIKLGDQPLRFREAVKPHLPEMAERKDFLPETARRLGATFFTENLPTSHDAIRKFFEHPEAFLLETIKNLAPDCRAAIAVVFMNGGQVRSPISLQDIEPAASFFGVSAGSVRDQLVSLNGSLLLLAQDDAGPFWTYKHPTVSDAFARYVAANSELVEVYLRGARPESITREVVCAGCNIPGAPVTVPDTLHHLLAERIISLENHKLGAFLSYRANQKFSKHLIELRPDILDRLKSFYAPIKDDIDTNLLMALYRQDLLPANIRSTFVERLKIIAVEDADASFLDKSIETILTDAEKADILQAVEQNVLNRVDYYIDRLQDDWKKDSQPEDHFDVFEASIERFVNALSSKNDYSLSLASAKNKISYAVARMNEDYEPSSSTSAPIASSTPQSTPLLNLFRDIDE